jgi:predicted nucleic acid-binding protein
VILLDTSIIMYAGGGLHPCKAPALRVLRRVAAGELAGAVNAEVLQEILHRFRGTPRWADGLRMYELARHAIALVLPITEGVMDRAVRLMQRHPTLSTRDAVHAATAMADGFLGICSFDADFDTVVGLKRFLPDEL